MKYIDADQLIAEIDRQNIGYNTDGEHAAEYNTCRKILDIITSLQQEKPDVDLDAEIDRFYRSDEYKMSHELGRGFEAIAYHFFDLGCTRTAVMYDDIEYKRQMAEEAEIANNLEEEIENYFDGWCNDDEYGDALMSDYTGVNVDNCKDIARFFAEWQREQMMEKAVEGRIGQVGFHNSIYIKEPEWCDTLDKFNNGDKVKVIVLPKEK